MLLLLLLLPISSSHTIQLFLYCVSLISSCLWPFIYLFVPLFVCLPVCPYVLYSIIVVVIAEVELATEQIVWLVIVGLLSWWLSVLMNLKIVIGFSVSNRHKTSGGGGAVVARRTVPDNTRHPGIHNYTAENATILWKCFEKMEEHSFSGHWRNSRNCYIKFSHACLFWSYAWLCALRISRDKQIEECVLCKPT